MFQKRNNAVNNENTEIIKQKNTDFENLDGYLNSQFAEVGGQSQMSDNNVKARMKLSHASGNFGGQIFYAQPLSQNASSPIQKSEEIIGEFRQSFEIKGYGKEGMAPSLLKPVVVHRQRPSSMMVKNALPTLSHGQNQSQFGQIREMPVSAQAFNRKSSEVTQQIPPLPKRRKIRPISSLCAKKAGLPTCFLEEPTKTKVVSKRISSAHHLLTQSQQNEVKEAFKMT